MPPAKDQRQTPSTWTRSDKSKRSSIWVVIVMISMPTLIMSFMSRKRVGKRELACWTAGEVAKKALQHPKPRDNVQALIALVLEIRVEHLEVGVHQRASTKRAHSMRPHRADVAIETGGGAIRQLGKVVDGQLRVVGAHTGALRADILVADWGEDEHRGSSGPERASTKVNKSRETGRTKPPKTAAPPRQNRTCSKSRKTAIKSRNRVGKCIAIRSIARYRKRKAIISRLVVGSLACSTEWGCFCGPLRKTVRSTPGSGR